MAQQRQHRRNYNEPGHAHELTFCCYRGFTFLNAERTCKWLAEAIEAARVDLNFDLWAYVFMPEHVHLIGRPRQAEYGFDRNVITPATLLNMIDYIHMNPVRRGLVENPEQWKWSSAVWYLGAGEVPIRVDPIPAEWLDDSS